MKKLSVLLACACLVLCARSSYADTILTGSTVRGAFFFLSDPNTNLFTPDKITVGGGKEFVYDDSVATYSANFSANKLVLRVNCDPGITLKKCDKEDPFAFVFKDALFKNAFFTIESDDLGALPLASNRPRVIGFVVLFPVSSKNSTLVLDIVPAPEPSGVALLGSGIFVIAFIARRRLHLRWH